MKRTNIGPDGVRFRAFFAALFFLFTLMMMALLTVTGTPLVLRIAVFVPAWIASLAGLQALHGTCVFLAARGTRSTEMGLRRIEDEEERAFFVRRAGRIHLEALAAAFLLTLALVGISILLPWRFPPG